MTACSYTFAIKCLRLSKSSDNFLQASFDKSSTILPQFLISEDL